MLSFPPLFILLPYGVFLFIILVLSLVNVRHLFRTGNATTASFTVTVSFYMFAVIILGVTWTLISSFDWDTPIVIGLSQVGL